MKLTGRAHKYGANVDTDVIIPARYLNVSDARELAKHVFEGTDPGFLSSVQPGDMIVADANFGCGSSREHAPRALKATSIACVVAKSFARIFFRNAINIGLSLLECPEAVDSTRAGDVLEIDLSRGEIKNITRNLTFMAKPYPEFMLALVNSGGLVEYTRRRLQQSRPS
ncbi:MAG: 3-isopropylmalate dehydratase small subunit [Chloroflexota bacterium]